MKDTPGSKTRARPRAAQYPAYRGPVFGPAFEWRDRRAVVWFSVLRLGTRGAQPHHEPTGVLSAGARGETKTGARSHRDQPERPPRLGVSLQEPERPKPEEPETPNGGEFPPVNRRDPERPRGGR